MLQVCRTCLTSIEGSIYYAVDAIDSTFDPTTRQEKIMFCVPEMVMDIVQNNVICKSCYDTLQLAYEFKRKCLQTEKILRDYLINNRLSEENVCIDLREVAQRGSRSYGNLGDSNEGLPLSTRRIILEEIDIIIKYAQDGTEYGAVFSHFMSEVGNDERYEEENTSTEFNEDVDTLLSRIPECVIEVKNPTNRPIDQVDKKSLMCDVCSKSFRARDKLERHRRMHTGEKPFKCLKCDKCFSRKDKLFLHKRTHTGEKPYSCEICNSKFSRSDRLRSHMRVHNKKLLSVLNVNETYT